jgi:hypothetical protein
MVIRGIGVLAYGAGILGFLICMAQGWIYAAGAILAACLAFAPLLLDGPWIKRLAGSVVMLFAFLGLVAGCVGFFVAISLFPWLASFVSGKGGVVWLLVVAPISGLVGGWLGEFVVKKLGRWLRWHSR